MAHNETGASVRRLIISVEELDSALAFYADVLGLALARRSEGFASLSTADEIEVLLHERPTAPSDSSVAAAFAVDRLDDMVAEWASRGGTVIDEPAIQPWGERMAVVRDADGHVVCLCEREA